MWRRFFFSCVPWPQGSTCPHTVHCWPLDFSSSPWCSRAGTVSLKTCCLAHLSLCDFGWGFACKQEGKWNRWTEIGAPVRVGRAPWAERRAPGEGGPHGYRVSLPANRCQPLQECWIFQNWEVPRSDGKAPGAVPLSTPFPAVFPHLCICCKTEWRLLWLVFALVTGKNKPFCFPVFLPLFSLCLLPAPPFLTWPGACSISLISINSDTSLSVDVCSLVQWFWNPEKSWQKLNQVFKHRPKQWNSF